MSLVYFNQLPQTGTPPKRYVDENSWNSVVGNAVGWPADVNGGGHDLSNVGNITASNINVTGNITASGSITVTGSINVAGIASTGQITAPSVKATSYVETPLLRSLTDMSFSVGADYPERMRITAGGNVGIGTDNPLNLLSVISPTAPSSSAAANQITIGESTNSPDYRLKIGIFADTSWKGSIQMMESGIGGSLLLNPLAGKIGIGTTNPRTPLAVSQAGNAPAVSGDQNTGVLIEQTYGGPGLNLGIASDAGNYCWIQGAFTNNAGVTVPIALQQRGGNVGIGTASPGALLDLTKSNSGGVGPELLLHNSAGAAGDKARISFYDTGTYRATIVQSLEPTAGYGGALDFCLGSPNSNPDALQSRLRIDGTGTIKMWLGGSLKTLSVDGSGFVKAT